MSNKYFQTILASLLVLLLFAATMAVFGFRARPAGLPEGSSISGTADKPSQFVFGTEKLKRYHFPTHINDLVIDRAQSLFSEVFVVVIEPNHAPPYHKHDENEQIFYVISGTGVLTIGDNKDQFSVKPGDVVRIPVSTYHSIKASDKDTLRYLSVDCFGEKPKAEPTWDDHVKGMCKLNGWDYAKVVSDNH